MHTEVYQITGRYLTLSAWVHRFLSSFYNLSNAKYHTAPHPDHRLPRHHDGQDASRGILLPLLLTEILQSPSYSVWKNPSSIFIISL